MRLFHEAGTKNIERLAQCFLEALWQRAHAANEAKGYTRVVPGLHDIKHYVDKAQELRKAIEYEPQETSVSESEEER